MDALEIKNLIESELNIAVEWDEKSSRITIQPAHLVSVGDFLWRHPLTYFDSLSCLTAIDNGPENGTLEIIYTLYSIPNHLTFHIRLAVPRLLEDGKLPIVPSLCGIWETANWHEREAFDLVGVVFEGHPDLTRILLPADWVGHPLRKDYVEQEKYHGIQVKF
jgi:NADH-quinone oxidoreductase subunit C